MWGAVISAGASLLGGALDRKQRRADAKANSPAEIRKTFEAAGFNPLLGISPAANSTANYAPTFGAAMANAGAAIADGFYQNSQTEIAKAQLEMENRRLEHLIEQTTLRPSIPGVYGDRNGSQNPSRLSGSDRSGDDDSDFGSTAGVAPNRDVDVDPYISSPGLFEMDNRLTGGGVVLPGGDGDPWGIDEAATAVIVGVPQVVRNWVNRGVDALGIPNPKLSDISLPTITWPSGSLGRPSTSVRPHERRPVRN